jgi:hypothetical protein
MLLGIFSLFGAALYRFRGMEQSILPRPFLQAAFALPYAVAADLYWPGFIGFFVGIIVCVLTTLAVSTGHGRGMDLGETDKGDPERLEFIIAWLKPHVPLYLYDPALLAVTGLAITIPAGVATLNPFIALSGLLKGPAYAVAKWGKTGTDGGELLTGAILWGALLYAY